jgi:hypothetical protein
VSDFLTTDDRGRKVFGQQMAIFSHFIKLARPLLLCCRPLGSTTKSKGGSAGFWSHEPPFLIPAKFD